MNQGGLQPTTAFQAVEGTLERTAALAARRGQVDVLGRLLAGRRRWAFEAGAVGLGLTLLYVLTLAGSNAEPDDGLSYAVLVRNGAAAGLFDPSHLVYSWLSWAAYNTARGFGYDGGPLPVMQLLDAAIGAWGVALLWYCLRSAVPGALVAIAACGVVAFSYGFWFYSVSAEVYVLSALFLILALMAARQAIAKPSPRAFALLGAANGLAVLGHTANVLFAAVALMALLMVVRQQTIRRGLQCGLAYVLAACAVVVPAYVLAAAVIGLETPRAVYEWYTQMARSGEWGFLSTATLPKAALGSERALIGEHFLLVLAPVRDLVQTRLPGQNPREELFLVRNLSQGVALLLCLPAAVVLLGLAASVLGWLSRPRLPEGGRVLALLCLAWLAAYVPFFVWWEPLNIEFWIVPWIPLAILCALPLTSAGRPAWRRWRVPCLVAVLASLFIVNLVGSVLPQQHESNDYWRVRATWYEQNVTSNDLILTDGYLWNSYLAYFSPAQTIDVADLLKDEDDDEAASLATVRQRVDQASSTGRVFISTELFYPDARTLPCCTDAAGATGIGALIRDAYGDRLQLVAQGPQEWVWQIR